MRHERDMKASPPTIADLHAERVHGGEVDS